jgi:hypothetical protein
MHECYLSGVHGTSLGQLSLPNAEMMGQSIAYSAGPVGLLPAPAATALIASERLQPPLSPLSWSGGQPNWHAEQPSPQPCRQSHINFTCVGTRPACPLAILNPMPRGEFPPRAEGAPEVPARHTAEAAAGRTNPSSPAGPGPSPGANLSHPEKSVPAVSTVKYRSCDGFSPPRPKPRFCALCVCEP